MIKIRHVRVMKTFQTEYSHALIVRQYPNTGSVWRYVTPSKSLFSLSVLGSKIRVWTPTVLRLFSPAKINRSNCYDLIILINDVQKKKAKYIAIVTYKIHVDFYCLSFSLINIIYLHTKNYIHVDMHWESGIIFGIIKILPYVI